jgi:hypothetical protein
VQLQPRPPVPCPVWPAWPSLALLFPRPLSSQFPLRSVLSSLLSSLALLWSLLSIGRDFLLTACVESGNEYTLHVYTSGGGKGNTLHVYTSGDGNIQPCTCILLVVERNTTVHVYTSGDGNIQPCTCILLVVERNRTVHVYTSGEGKGYTLVAM